VILCINGRVHTFIVLHIFEEVCRNYLKLHIRLSYVCVCVLGLEILCGYEASESGYKWACTPIHVNIIILKFINNITSFHVDRLDEKRWGANSTRKREKGET